MTRAKNLGRFLDNYALLLVFITMVVAFTILAPTFFTISNLLNVLVAAAPTGIATIGMAIVILQGGIDLSAGSIMYMGAIVCTLIMGKNLSPVVFVLLSLATGALIGLANGFLITRFKVVPFIETYGMSMLIRGIALTMSGQKNIIFSDPVASVLCSQKLFAIPVVVFIFIIIVVLISQMLSKTPYGRHLYALGNNPTSAVRLGLKVNTIRLTAYVICGALAAFCGLLSGAQAGAFNPSLGSGKDFSFISAAVLGGVSLSGGKCRIFPNVVLGIMIITSIESGLVMMSANPYLYQIVRGTLIALAVIIDSINHSGDLR